MNKQKKRVLYIGLDESNHGRFPEVCVAVFSKIPEDAHLHKFFCKGDPTLLCKLPSENRDYRFLFLREGQTERSQTNLSIVASSLILPYFRSRGRFDRIEIYIDGRLNYWERTSIKESLSEYSGSFFVKGFIKHWKRNCRHIRSYIQPYILGIADSKAHSLYDDYNLASGPDITKITHPKLVQLL